MAAESKAVPSNQRPRFTVQHPTYLLGLTAVQMAVHHDNWDELRPVLEDELPFNSRSTRTRFSSYLRKWALEDGNLDSLGTRVWAEYKDEHLTNQVLKERYLDTYPVIGRFVSRTLVTLEIGAELGPEMVGNFLTIEQVSAFDKSVKTLRLTMRDMGFIRMVGRGKPVVSPTSLPNTAFLILLHHHFALEPTTISVSQIIEHPFWRYLGGRDEVEVRAALSQATAKDAIARYATVDNLEQITTRFSLDELLMRQVRLDT